MTGTRHTEGSPAENDRRPKGGPEDPITPRTRRHRQAPPTAPTFTGQSRRRTAGAAADD